MSPVREEELLSALREKQSQLADVIGLAAGVEAGAVVKTSEAGFMAVPGDRFMVAATVRNNGKQTVHLRGIELQAPAGWKILPEPQPKKEIRPGEYSGVAFWVTPPPNAPETRMWEHRPDPERDSIYTVDAPQFETLPFPPPPLHVVARYVVQGICGTKPDACPEVAVSSPVDVTSAASDGKTSEHPLAVAPAFSILLDPSTQVVRIGQGTAAEAAVHVHSNLEAAAEASLSLELPPGWRAEPNSLAAKFGPSTQDQTFNFKVLPGPLAEKTYELKAVLSYSGKRYAEGYSVVTRPDLGEFFLLPAGDAAHQRRRSETAARRESRLHHGRG